VEQVKREHPEIEIEEIEILTNMVRTRQDGVRTLPTLIIGQQLFYHALPLEELLAVITQAELSPDAPKG